MERPAEFFGPELTESPSFCDRMPETEMHIRYSGHTDKGKPPFDGGEWQGCPEEWCSSQVLPGKGFSIHNAWGRSLKEREQHSSTWGGGCESDTCMKVRMVDKELGEDADPPSRRAFLGTG